jgi:predicted nuclease of predicted toxin-antitoxin system
VRFKSDENVPVSVVALLRDAGHDVQTVLDERLGGALDAQVVAAATHEQRSFITLDKDFSDIREYPPSHHSGIVVLRAGDQATARIRTLVTRLLPLLDTDDLAGKLWIVDERRVRVRR